MSRNADRWLGLALFGATVCYVAAWPNNLGDSDESLFLYEAKRVLDGAVLYREVFEIITPASLYLFALLFGVFGTTLTVARLAMAVVHGLIVVTVFASCRALDVRRGLAVAAGLTHLALGQPAWPFASPHWLSTLLTVALLYAALRRPWAQQARGAAMPGLIVGLAVAIQQQKGTVLTAAGAALLLLDAALERRVHGVPSLPLLARRLVYYTAAIALIDVPLFAIVLARAGFHATYVALVEYPLFHYRPLIQPYWGEVGLLAAPFAPYTWPALLMYLPATVLVVAARAALQWRSGNTDRARSLAGLAVVGVGAVASVGYAPDFIHLAFIAPVFFVAAAELVEAVLSALLAPPRRRAAGALLAAALLGTVAVQLSANLRRARGEYPVQAETAFGRIDFRTRAPVALLERIDALLDAAPVREVFCYPVAPMVYLATASDNPTPFQILNTEYHDAATIQGVIDTLERRRTPFVVLLDNLMPPDDPVVRYVREHYDRVDDLPLYRRRAEAAS